MRFDVLPSLLVLILLASLPFTVRADIPRGWLQEEFRLFRVYPRLDRAEKFYREGKFTDARVMLEQAVAIDTGYVQAFRLLIEVCIKLEEFQCVTDRAEQLLEHARASP